MAWLFTGVYIYVELVYIIEEDVRTCRETDCLALMVLINDLDDSNRGSLVWAIWLT